MNFYSLDYIFFQGSCTEMLIHEVSTIQQLFEIVKSNIQRDR